ncbi:hypothetical protein BUE80_DR012158 [Diplocarpon rosae]|nr:hypothetical protein BUE80_DR012158 [Diplocarpon rosae]
MEFMWADFMLDDPRMTNSTFVEGYLTDGSLGYVYANVARLSHAHGWATGPTSALTFLGAGIQLVTAVGATWLVQPRLGGLKRLTAGYETPLGEFAAEWREVDGGGVAGKFHTPHGTEGTLIIPVGSVAAVVRGPRGMVKPSTAGNGTLTFANLPGGRYSIQSGQVRH